MKISDLFESEKSENEKYDKEIKKQLMDVLMMFKTNDVQETDVNNVISELSDKGYSVSKDDIVDIIENMDEFEVEDDLIKLVVDDEEAIEEPDEMADDDPSVEGEGTYSEIDQIAKKATDERMDD